MQTIDNYETVRNLCEGSMCKCVAYLINNERFHVEAFLSMSS